MQIILASASPRRKELLSLFGIDFTVKVPHIHENIQNGEKPGDFCRRISLEKAFAVGKDYNAAAIIAADTVVVVEGNILGKPRDERQAHEFLMMLKNREHDVFTGYAIVIIAQNTTRTNVVQTRVHFNDMSTDEIAWYIASREPMDKAGAYAIQGLGSIFIDRIQGSFSNVIGLPLSHLYDDLKALDIPLKSHQGGN